MACTLKYKIFILLHIKNKNDKVQCFYTLNIKQPKEEISIAVCHKVKIPFRSTQCLIAP